jgi:hypothetical protein
MKCSVEMPNSMGMKAIFGGAVPLILAAAVCAACGGGTAPVQTGASAAATSGGAGTAASGSPDSLASGGAPSGATSGAKATGKPSPPPRESPFFVAYEQPHAGLRVNPMGQAAIVVSGEGYLSGMLLMDSKGVREDESLYKGLPGHTKPDDDIAYFMLLSVSGDWPKSGRLSINTPGERGGTDLFYELRNGAWSPLSDPHTEAYYRAYYGGVLSTGTSFKGGDLYVIMEDGKWRFLFDSKKKGVTVPVMADAPKGLPCPKRLYRYLELASLPAGELFGLGQACVAEDEGAEAWGGFMPSKGPLAVERWAAGARTSTLDVLPGQSGLRRAYSENVTARTSIYARSPNDVYVASSLSADGTEAGVRPYVAHFDGRAWSEIAMPAKGWLTSFAAASKDEMLWAEIGGALYKKPAVHTGKDGPWERVTPQIQNDLRFWEIGPDASLWVRYGDALFRRPQGGAWEEIAMPSRDSNGKAAVYLPTRLTFWNSEVIVVSDKEEGREDQENAAILRSTKPEAVLRAKAPRPELAPSALVKAATPRCSEVFVVLYKLAKTAPADFDFPLTREALKGHREFAKAEFAETLDGGRRYFVAFVPTFAMGQSLVKLVTEKVKGSAPQLLCGKPAVNRKIKFDLGTGAMVK